MRFARNADALGEFTQNIFLCFAAELPVRREAGDVLDEDVVEDRGAGFQRVQHAHAIDFGENVIDHVGLRVDV